MPSFPFTSLRSGSLESTLGPKPRFNGDPWSNETVWTTEDRRNGLDQQIDCEDYYRRQATKDLAEESRRNNERKQKKLDRARNEQKRILEKCRRKQAEKLASQLKKSSGGIKGFFQGLFKKDKRYRDCFLPLKEQGDLTGAKRDTKQIVDVVCVEMVSFGV